MEMAVFASALDPGHRLLPIAQALPAERPRGCVFPLGLCRKAAGDPGITLRRYAPFAPVTSSPKNLSSLTCLRFWEGTRQPAGFQEPAHSFQEESALVIH